MLLQKRYRIHVHGEPNATRGFAGERLIGQFLQALVFRTAEGEMPPIFSFQARQWLGRRTQEIYPLPRPQRLAQEGSHPVGFGDHTRLVATVEQQVDETRMRRVERIQAGGQLGPIERFVILSRRRGECVMLGLVRLKDDPPGTGSPSRTARDLSEKLERALGASEVRQRQLKIGIDDADEGYSRKVQTLGYHLRP